MEKLAEVMPPGIRNAGEGSDVIPGLTQGCFGQEASVLTEGDEDYAVYEFLSYTDSVIQSLIVWRVAEVLDQNEAIVMVIFIQFITDFTFTFIASFKKKVCMWGLADGRWEKSVAVEYIVELEKYVSVTQVLQSK
jgi:hypothetical protein